MSFNNANCPACKGADLSTGTPLTAQQGELAGGILLPMECENCGAAWTAVYRPTGFVKLVNSAKTHAKT